MIECNSKSSKDLSQQMNLIGVQYQAMLSKVKMRHDTGEKNEVEWESSKSDLEYYKIVLQSCELTVMDLS